MKKRAHWIIGILVIVAIIILVVYKNESTPSASENPPTNQQQKLLTQNEAVKLVQELPEVKTWADSHKAVYEVVVDGTLYDVMISEEKNGQKTTHDLYFVDMKTGEVSKNAGVDF